MGGVPSTTIALDLRYLQAAFRHSDGGGLGGVGVYSRGLWRALREQRPSWKYVAVVDRGPVTSTFHALLDESAPATIAAGGLAGAVPFPLRISQSRWSWLPSMVETELGWGSALRRLTEPVDILHGLGQLPPPRRSAPARIVTIYDLIPLGADGTRARTALARARRAYIARIARAERFLCISESTRRDLLSITDISPARAHVVYPGIDTETFHPLHCGAGELLERYGVRSPYFLNVGVCFGRKNPGTLLQAFQKLTATRTGRDASLVFVGPYDVIEGSAERIRRAATDLGVSGKVSIIGNVGDADLARLYTSAAALVFPSLYEGFGYPALESLACGTPAIVSACSSLPEAVGTLGRLVDPRDCDDVCRAMLERLNELPGGRLEAQGAAWARRFSWEATANACVQVYEEVLN